MNQILFIQGNNEISFISQLFHQDSNIKYSKIVFNKLK